MKTTSYEVIGMHCMSCSTGIRKLLLKTKGIDNVDVILSKSRLDITYDEKKVDHKVIADTVSRLGYKAVPAE